MMFTRNGIKRQVSFARAADDCAPATVEEYGEQGHECLLVADRHDRRTRMTARVPSISLNKRSASAVRSPLSAKHSMSRTCSVRRS